MYYANGQTTGLSGIIKTEGHFNFWNPKGIANADFTTTGFKTLEVSLDFQSTEFATNIFPALPQLSYEWTPNQKLRQDESLLQFATETAAEMLFAKIPIFKVNASLVNVEINRRSFLAEVVSRDEKVFSNRNSELTAIHQHDTLSSKTTFNTVSLTIDTEVSSLVSGKLGLSYLQYRKPYTPTIGDTQISDLITDASFKAIGAGGIFEFKELATGVPLKGFKIRAGLQYGIGKIDLGKTFELSDFSDEINSDFMQLFEVDFGAFYQNNFFSEHLIWGISGTADFIIFKQFAQEGGSEPLIFNGDAIYSVNLFLKLKLDLF